MASSGARTLTFLRGSGFLLSLVGVWDLVAEVSGPTPAPRGFLIFNEAKITGVIERDQQTRRGIEGTYAIEDNRLVLTHLSIDTAPAQGVLREAEFQLDGDTLRLKWLAPNTADQVPQHVDTFRRRGQSSGEVVLLPRVAIYESDAPPGTSQ